MSERTPAPSNSGAPFTTLTVTVIHRAQCPVPHVVSADGQRKSSAAWRPVTAALRLAMVLVAALFGFHVPVP